MLEMRRDRQAGRRRAAAGAGLAALAFTAVLNVWRDNAGTVRWTPVIFAGLFLCLFHAPAAVTKRGLLVFGALGVLAAFFLTAGPLVYTPDGVPRRWPWYAPCVLLFFAAVLAPAFGGLSALLRRVTLRGPDAPMPPRRVWLRYAGVLVALWLPAALAFGPLRISADSYNVIQQALGAYPLQDNHPVLYTLLVRLFLGTGRALGGVTAAAWLFGAVQMCFWAGVLSYTLCWMKARGCPAPLVWLALGYYTLTPVFAVNAITLWKDIPFNAVLLLYCLQLYQAGASRGESLLRRGGAGRFLLAALAVCFLRGNGFWLALAGMLAVALAFRRHWRRWLALFLPFLVAVPLVLGPLYAALGLTRLGSVESASLPLQQVARAVQNGAPLTESQQAVIEAFMPVETMKAAYVSASPDHIKTHAEFDSQAFDENVGPFMGLWAQLLPTNKQVYLDAWLLTTLGYWKVDFHGWTALTSEFEEPAPTGIARTDWLQALTGVDFRAFLANRTGFLSLSGMAFLLLFCAAHLLAAKRGGEALFFVPMLAVWAGLMLGAPTYCEFRYMLVFALGLPCALFLTAAPADAGVPCRRSEGEQGEP